MTKNWPRYVGILGTVGCIAFFIHEPSWPTPDKILVFITFVFMCFGQAWEMLKRFVPFVGLLLIYESFRGLADDLHQHVNFSWMPSMDRKLFGELPTITLQRWLTRSSLQWYDFLFYLAYMMHFIFPIILAILVWKKRAKEYWKVISTYVVLSFAGFLTYLIFPAAPPWMASDAGVIPRINHLASNIWLSLGIHDFKIAYGKINPNPVAAIPSLHAAYSVLFVIFIYKFFGKKWGSLSLIYPFLIFVGTVYLGEHYAIDIILGAFYAVGVYYLVEIVFSKKLYKKLPFATKLQAKPAKP